MKKFLSKQITRLVLALVMVVGLLPLAARAETEYGYRITIDEATLYNTATTQTFDLVKSHIVVYEPTLSGNTVKLRFKPYFFTPNTTNGETDAVLIEETFEIDCTKALRVSGTYTPDPYTTRQFTVKYTITRDAGSHSGGTATCTTRATCSTCNRVYGNVDADNHGWGAWTASDATHSRTCTYNAAHTESGDHGGGTATCTMRATCSTCKQTYGTTNNNHSWGAWTTANGKHTRSCMRDSSHTESGSCDYKPATCTAASACSVCKYEYAEKLGHNLAYTADGNVLTETCSNGCGHTAKAILTVSKESYTYTGSPITPAAVLYQGSWQGTGSNGLTYFNNKDVGTATVESTVAGNKISATFEITPADIGSAAVTFDPERGVYDGSRQDPEVSVAWNGKTLTENKDYTLVWDQTGFTDADTYKATVTGKGNFKGTKSAVFSIAPAEIKEAVVTLDRDTFVYDGTAHKPTVVVTFYGETLTEGKDYTLYYMGEDQIMAWKNGEPTKFSGKANADCINAGVYYAVVYGKGNFAENSRFAYAEYVIEKAVVTEPTIASKPYNGSEQKADIADTDLYTVTQNNGGTGVKLNGYYDVVLELKDSANYKWSTTDNAQVTLQFAITRAANEWTATPSISGWTYGETAKVPEGAAKFGEVSVQYTGTANDGTAYSSTTAPTMAGDYTAAFIVAETEDYKGLETSVDFTIEKATYDMTGAKWDYTSAFKYDGKEHKVEVTGLPAGVTVKEYADNSATAAGSYTAKATLDYDGNNYNAPVLEDLNWRIRKYAVNPQTGDNSMLWLWMVLLSVGAIGVVTTAVIGKKKFSR